MSIVETKIALGKSSGLAMVPYGRCFIKGQLPLSNKSDINSFRPRVSHWSTLCERISLLPSDSIIICSIFLLAPRLIDLIVPETGDTILILGSFLLKKTGSPALTISPSLTESFGVNPKKSSGFSAYVEEEILLEIIFSADPFKFRLAPL